jgi:hypothetical protein
MTNADRAEAVGFEMGRSRSGAVRGYFSPIGNPEACSQSVAYVLSTRDPTVQLLHGLHCFHGGGLKPELQWPAHEGVYVVAQYWGTAAAPGLLADGIRWIARQGRPWRRLRS